MPRWVLNFRYRLFFKKWPFVHSFIRIALLWHVQLPTDNFLAIIMEWVHPKSERKGAELLNSMSVTVKDVEAEIVRAREAGIKTEPAVRRSYPVLGDALVGAVFVDGSRVELCEFGK